MKWLLRRLPWRCARCGGKPRTWRFTYPGSSVFHIILLTTCECGETVVETVSVAGHSTWYPDDGTDVYYHIVDMLIEDGHLRHKASGQLALP